jgi:WD40 repeat protein
VTCASLSPDGRYALSGSEEGALKLWEVETGRCLQTFAGEGIGTVATSPDGRFALTGSADGYLRLYEAASGRCLRTFRGHRFGVSCVCISPDGRFALSGEGGAQSLGKGFEKKL